MSKERGITFGVSVASAGQVSNGKSWIARFLRDILSPFTPNGKAMNFSTILASLPILAGVAGICLAQPSEIHEQLPVGSKWKFHLESTQESTLDYAIYSTPKYQRSGDWSKKTHAILDGEFVLKKPMTTAAKSIFQRVEELGIAIDEAFKTEDFAALTQIDIELRRLMKLLVEEIKGSIEGTASGSVESSVSDTPYQMVSAGRTIRRECANLPTATYALQWVVGGYFSSEAIVLYVGPSVSSADLTAEIFGTLFCFCELIYIRPISGLQHLANPACNSRFGSIEGYFACRYR